MSLPVEFIKKYQNLLGEEESNKFFASIDSPSKKGFRLNPLKNNYQDVQYSLEEPIEFTSDGYYGEVSGRDSEWTGGYVYSQDPSAMYPAVALNVKPGEKVLDLCAAPGGKSTALASFLENKGLLVANEISKSRAKDLRENLERWGATNVVVINESPERLSKKLPHFFDKILVDAPCSGEGMFRKDPAAMQYWSPEYVLTCQTRQAVSIKVKKKKHQKNSSVTRLTKDEITTVEEILDHFVLPVGLKNWQKAVLQSNGHVFVPAIDPELLNELHILNNGVELGLLKKKRFEPSHQLAEVLGQKAQKQLLNLKNKADYEHYLHGETIKVNSDLRGFVLVAFQNHIFSFGKIGNDQILKNFYPKGLRK